MPSEDDFAGTTYPNVPRRAAELAMAIQMANAAVFEKARSHREDDGMGTTVLSARFSPNKQRVYIGHVGDSRCYRCAPRPHPGDDGPYDGGRGHQGASPAAS